MINSIDAAFPYLSVLIALPALAALALWLIRPLHNHARSFGLAVSLLELAIAVVAAGAMDWTVPTMHQLAELHPWITPLGVSYAVAANGLAMAMVLLATFLVPLVMAAAWKENTQAAPGASVARRQMGFVALTLFLEAFMVLIFVARDVFLFYITFEAMLIPVYFLIGNFGGVKRRQAALKFLLYSLAGGLIMLVGVIALYVLGPGGEHGFLIDTLVGTSLSTTVERLIFASFFIAFAIKAPMWPVHTWLPDTAAQASPGTSVLLVSVLDKVGTYGMIALVFPLFPNAVRWAGPVIVVFALLSIIIGGLVAIGQRNIMRLIAYTSVSHFGFMVLGLFAGQAAFTGAMVYMVAHGVATAGMFLAAGFLARRGGTYRIMSYGGWQRVTPVLAGFFLISGLASSALPGLSGFIPEYLVLVGTFTINTTWAIIAVFGVVLSALYILLPYQRIFTGPDPRSDRADNGAPLTEDNAHDDAATGHADGDPVAVQGGDGEADQPLAVGVLNKVRDLDGREKAVMAPLIAAMLVLGFYPAPLIDAVRPIAENTALYESDGSPREVVDSLERYFSPRPADPVGDAPSGSEVAESEGSHN